MQVNLKRKPKHEVSGTEFMDLAAGNYLASLDRENKNQVLIVNSDACAAVIRVKDHRPLILEAEEEIFNIVKVNIMSINLEEV